MRVQGSATIMAAASVEVDDLLDELDDLLADKPAAKQRPPQPHQPSQPLWAAEVPSGSSNRTTPAYNASGRAGDADIDSLLAELDDDSPPPRPTAPAARLTSGYTPSRPAVVGAFPSSSGGSDEHATNLRCSKCDFKVLRFQGSAWTEEADYMFFRNYMPNVTKLEQRLNSKDGHCAYACQCDWVTTEMGVAHGRGHWFMAR
jgi:hypothetical protein